MKKFFTAIAACFMLLLALPLQADAQNSKTIIVNVEASRPSYEGNAILSNIPIEKLLLVIVTDQDQNRVPNASVTVSGQGVPALPVATTDESGIAALVIETSGTYTVLVRHNNYATAESKIEINTSDGQDNYILAITLNEKPNKELQRPLRVTVLDEKTRKGIAGAQVNTNEGNMATDKNGVAYFKKVLALGESGRVQVTANGYQFAEQLIIGGGENYRYAPPAEDEVTFYLKRSRPTQVNLVVQVLDYSTQRPVGKATVTVNNQQGKALATGAPTNARGETKIPLKGEVLDNAPLRLQAKATGYTENWSDITADFLNLDYDTLVFTINIRQSKAAATANEKKYGPYLVSSGKWRSTGITFKKGDYFRVEASGYFTAKDGQKIGPEGGGYWTWWTLAGQIGTQRLTLSRNGGGQVTEAGVLELGTPRGLGSKEFVKEDVENLQGTLTVFVFSKNGEYDRSSIYADAEKDIQFLKRLLQRDESINANRRPDEIMQQFRYIASKYGLFNTKVTVDGTLKTCYDIMVPIILSNFQMHNNDREYQDCLSDAIKIMEMRMMSQKPPK